MNVSQLSIVLDAGQVMSGIDRIERELAGLNKQVGKTNGQLGGMGKGMKSLGGLGGAVFKGFAAGIAAIGFTKLIGGIISANAEFSKLEASINLMTGSGAMTANIMAQMGRISQEIGVPVDALAEGFIKLRNLGLEPSERALKSYANVAAGSGKDMMMFVEAVADAATAEFERLKEFGIRAKNQGDTIAFTFQGVTTTVKNNAKEIEEYMMSIGEVNFAGAAEAQAKSLAGQLTALSGQIRQAAVDFGKAGFNEGLADLLGVFKDAIPAMKPFLDMISKMAGSGLSKIADMLKSAGAAISEFMNAGSDMGGVFVTNGDKIMAVFQTIIEVVGNVISYLWEAGVNTFGSWVTAIQDVYMTFKPVFDWIAKAAVFVFRSLAQVGVAAFKAVVSYIQLVPKNISRAFAAVRSFFTGLGGAAAALLRGDFAGIGKALGTITIQPLLDGLGEGVGILREFNREANLTAGNDAFSDVGDIFNRRQRENSVNRTTGGPTTDPNRDYMGEQGIDTPDQDTAGEESPASKRARERREDELKKALERLRGEMDSLVGTYAPMIERAREYAKAQKTIADVAALSDTQLAAMGVTMEQVIMIRDRMEADFAKPMGQLDLEDLQFEAQQLALGTDAASVAAGEFAEYMRDAEASYKDITPEMQEKIRLQMLANEQLARELDMKDDLKGYATDVQTEIRLMGLVGKERERQINLIEAENRARENGWDVQAYVASIRRGMDMLDQERERFNTFGFGLRKVVVEYSEAVQDVARQTEDAVGNIVSSLEDTLTEFFKTGKFNWRDFLSDIANEMARFAARNAVMQFMKLFAMGGGGGGIGGMLSSIFGGFRENGGPVQAGKSYVVGEKRAEVFTPGTSGYIHPEVRQSSGSGTSISISMPAMSLSIQGDGTNFDYDRLNQMMERNANETLNKTVQVIQDELRHNGIFR